MRRLGVAVEVVVVVVAVGQGVEAAETVQRMAVHGSEQGLHRRLVAYAGS